jgi:hypothetical protein
MSEDTNNVASETVSEQPTQETPTNSTDVGALIAESKKYRKRSQDAEARITELEKAIAKTEEAKLKEKEDFKTLYEKVASENEALSSVADKWNKYESSKRESLLDQHPENLPLDTLEFVTGKINNIKPNAPQVVGQTKQPKLEKTFSEMSDAEKSSNWQSILKAYKK